MLLRWQCRQCVTLAAAAPLGADCVENGWATSASQNAHARPLRGISSTGERCERMKTHIWGMRLGMRRRMKTGTVMLAVGLGAHERTGERMALMDRARLSVGLRRATVVALLLGA